MLQVALVVSTRATCPRLKVGAVLTREGHILSTGYNGAPAGLEHCTHPLDQPCAFEAVHAEANALVFAARWGQATDGGELFCTDAPCRACAGLIVNAGVTRVVYLRDFRNDEGLALLGAAGVWWERAEPSGGS